MNTFFQIRKVDEEKRLVYGRATQEVLDRSGEVMDYDSSKPLIQAWSDETAAASGGLSKGNVRSMHRNDIAAGKVVEIEFDDTAKAVDLVVKVVDDAEWAKVTEGVYSGFSMGGKYAKKWSDPSITTAKGTAAVRYTAVPSEISLVDRPCVPTAGFFDIMKADGTTVQKAFHQEENTMDENKGGEPSEMKKGLWEAKRFLDLIEDARWLQRGLADEKTREGDASTVPEDLKVCLGMIADLAESYIGEQLAELKAGGPVAAASEAAGEAHESAEAGKSAGVEDMAKAARTGKKALREQIHAASEDIATMCKAYLDLYKEAAEDDADKLEPVGDLAKAAPVDVESAVRRAVSDAMKPIEAALAKNAAPAPAAKPSAPAPALRAIAKADDAERPAPTDDLAKRAETDPIAAIQLAQRNPLAAN